MAVDVSSSHVSLAYRHPSVIVPKMVPTRSSRAPRSSSLVVAAVLGFLVVAVVAPLGVFIVVRALAARARVVIGGDWE
tara:strand:+ start:119 stop:352 length:234 start_codon:yes stop_codon:yes gene_type:complete